MNILPSNSLHRDQKAIRKMKEKEITIETPEKIQFPYIISHIGTRIGAYMIDLIIQFLIILLFGLNNKNQ